MSEDLQLSDNRVVLCGANGTLGRAIARKLADEGAHLALLGRKIDQLRAVAEGLPASASGRPHLVVGCDLGQQVSIDAAIDTAENGLGGIDVFISAAGASQGGIFWELDDAAWQRNLEVKLFGTLRILFLGALLTASTNLLFALLNQVGHNLELLTLIISLDNLSAGIATAAFVTYLSSLTNVAFSATQYALFSSVMLLLPKLLAGFSGQVVEQIGYSAFFVGTSLLGLPVLLLIVLVARKGSELLSTADK